MNPFDYTLEEAKKAAVALVSAAVVLVGFFIVFEPSTGPAILAVVVQLFAVIGVFAAKNTTADDVSKALTSLEAAVISVVGLFATVPTDTGEKIASIIVLLVPVFFVHQVSNRRTS